jgi:restriction system protein
MNRQESLSHVWLVRAGRHGEDERAALDNGLVIIGFVEIGDLTPFSTFDEMLSEWQRINPDVSPRSASNQTGQLNTFRNRINEGDIVVLPLKSRPGQVALGRVSGPYNYQEVGGEMRHTRRIDWINPDVPRSKFQQDLLYSLGAFMTVCQITRNDAEKRISQILEGGDDPGAPGAEDGGGSEVDVDVLFLDIAQAAHDEIVAFVRANFQGHDLARLVDAILIAEGFLTYRSAPGPDGGADILVHCLA